MNSGLYFQIGKDLLHGEVLILPPKKSLCPRLVCAVRHTSLKRVCPHIVAMQAVSGSRKDCDSLFLLNEVPCVNVVYMGKYFVHSIFPHRVLLSFHTRYALKWTQTNPYINVVLHYFNHQRWAIVS